jgi:hypothetical protein
MTLPLLRQLSISIQSLAASPRAMVIIFDACCLTVQLRALKKGTSLYLMPGGIAELCMSDPTVEKICAFHKGFVRIAMKAGVPIVPVYILGHTRLFHLTGADSPLVSLLSRFFKVALTVYYGQVGAFSLCLIDVSQYCLPIPFKAKLTFIVGAPIVTGPPNANPSEADVDALHAKYLDAVQRLFNENKHRDPAFNDTELVFIKK